MIDAMELPSEPAEAEAPLPTLVHVDQAFNTRLPSQRVIDALTRAEPGLTMGEVVQTQPFRLVAFRALLRDFPGRDTASLWMHAYEVEVQVHDVDPTNGNGLTASLPSAGSGA